MGESKAYKLGRDSRTGMFIGIKDKDDKHSENRLVCSNKKLKNK